MTTWSLTIAGVTKTLAQWGVFGITLNRVNLAGDTLVFSAPRRTFAAASLCAYGDTITLLRTEGGVTTTWFTGTNQTIPSTAEAGAQVDTYTVLSPWRWLAQNVFQQPWFNGTIYTSHIITAGTIGANIKAVLDYAIANGANLAYVQADLDALNVFPPANEFTEKNCAQVILENLQFNPDVVVWFNYATLPKPTLRFVRRAELQDVTLRMASHADESLQSVAAVTLTPRPDLQIPSAKINIEVIEEVDGEQRLIPGVDIYPPGSTGREDGAFNATITIQGRTINTVSGEIECATIEHASLDWWKLHVPALRDARLTILTGPASVTAYDGDGNALVLGTLYPAELIEGQIAPWMELNWQRITLKAKFAVQFDAAGETLRLEDEKEYAIELVTTDAPDGVSSYQTVANADSGDPVPTGLAEYIYTSLSELHYQGALQLVQPQCNGIADLGYVVNLAGSQTAHADMRALVQETTFDFDSGTTRIQCGPPRHLGLGDLLALLQRFRVRRRWTNPDTQATGDLGGGSGELALGRATPNNAGTPGEGVTSKFVVKDGNNLITLDATVGRVTVTDGTRTILLDAALGRIFINSITLYAGSIDLLLSATGGQSLAIAPIGVCDNGVNRNVRVLRGPLY